MVSLQFVSVYSNSRSLPISFKHFSKYGDYCRSVSSSSFVVHAGEEEFELDPDKAREALQKLDFQIQQLSQKQVSPPKTKALDVKITRDYTSREGEEDDELKEVSGSTVALVTAAFFLFTIFYNIFYITVIDKPR